MVCLFFLCLLKFLLFINKHPKDHCSFASNHPGHKVLEVVKLSSGLDQVLWPDHCVQGTAGAEIHKDLVVVPEGIIVNKGTHTDVDSYSAFFDNGGNNPTPLEGILREHGITTNYLLGIAYDYCLGSSTFDSQKLGFKTYCIEDATKGIAVDSTKAMREKLQAAGVLFINSTDL